jgi:hypothetical protein
MSIESTRLDFMSILSQKIDTLYQCDLYLMPIDINLTVVNTEN